MQLEFGWAECLYSLLNLLIGLNDGSVEEAATQLYHAIGEFSIDLRLILPGNANIIEWNASQGDGDANQQISRLIEVGQQHENHADGHEDNGQSQMHFDWSRQIRSKGRFDKLINAKTLSKRFTHLLWRNQSMPAMLATTESHSTELK